MTQDAPPQHLLTIQKAAVVVFVVMCGWPALEMNGFGFGLHISFLMALILATVGGVLSGVMVCPQSILAGILGGFVAGSGGLCALYLYTLARTHVLSVELVLVQGLASLPGLGLGVYLKEKIESRGLPVQVSSAPGKQTRPDCRTARSGKEILK
jgi:hypothetical protein